MNKEQTFKLSPVEVETMRRAAHQRSKSFDPTKLSYSSKELDSYGLVREGYTREEISKLGIKPSIVTSKDKLEEIAQSELLLDTPFGSKIKKWQIPVDMMPIRVAKTIFPKNSVVNLHVHPKNTDDDPGGGLRMVAKGSVNYRGENYLAGDWFFVPNGTSYEFTTSKNEETILFYTYTFFGAAEGNRFSHPHI